MRSTFSLLLYINRSKVRADGTTAVLCRISIDGKSTTITTGISCNPKQWNAKTAETAEVRTNNRLKEFRKHAEQLYAEPVSYTHLTLPTTARRCRSRWSPYH